MIINTTLMHHVFLLALVEDHKQRTIRAEQRPTQQRSVYRAAGKVLIRFGQWLQARSHVDEELIVAHN